MRAGAFLCVYRSATVHSTFPCIARVYVCVYVQAGYDTGSLFSPSANANEENPFLLDSLGSPICSVVTNFNTYEILKYYDSQLLKCYTVYINMRVLRNH